MLQWKHFISFPGTLEVKEKGSQSTVKKAKARSFLHSRHNQKYTPEDGRSEDNT